MAVNGILLGQDKQSDNFLSKGEILYDETFTKTFTGDIEYANSEKLPSISTFKKHRYYYYIVKAGSYIKGNVILTRSSSSGKCEINFSSVGSSGGSARVQNNYFLYNGANAAQYTLINKTTTEDLIIGYYMPDGLLLSDGSQQFSGQTGSGFKPDSDWFIYFSPKFSYCRVDGTLEYKFQIQCIGFN